MGSDRVVRWVVSGKVQGVGFRWYVRSRAIELGVGGWVRNRSDGSVEIVASAAAERLTSFEALVRRGPPGARVESIATGDVPHESVDTKSFDIKG